MAEVFCPICHPERLPTEARLSQPAHAGHIATRFDMDTRYVEAWLNARSLNGTLTDEVLCGVDGWALSIARRRVDDDGVGHGILLCPLHPYEPLRQVAYGYVCVTRVYEPEHVNR